MEDDRLEILPWGRTPEQQKALERKKRSGKRGLGGCLLYAVAFALVAVYCAGWMQGKHSDKGLLTTRRYTRLEQARSRSDEPFAMGDAGNREARGVAGPVLRASTPRPRTPHGET